MAFSYSVLRDWRRLMRALWSSSLACAVRRSDWREATCVESGVDAGRPGFVLHVSFALSVGDDSAS